MKKFDELMSIKILFDAQFSKPNIQTFIAPIKRRQYNHYIDLYKDANELKPIENYPNYTDEVAIYVMTDENIKKIMNGKYAKPILLNDYIIKNNIVFSVE